MRLLRIALVLLPGLCLLPAKAQAQAPPPYTLQQIVELLSGGFSGAEVLRQMGRACISFAVTAAAEAELRRAGADDAMVRSLRSKCPSNAPTGRGIVSIIGELPPGWARTVNELPANTNREIDLTPNRAATIVVSAPGWCPDRTQVTLAAHDTVRWRPSLRGRPWVGGC